MDPLNHVRAAGVGCTRRRHVVFGGPPFTPRVPRFAHRLAAVTGLALGWALLTFGGDAPENPFEDLKGYNFGPDRSSLAAIEDQVRAALGNAQDTAALEDKLLVLLQSDASLGAKQFACRQLRLIGSARAVPVLGRLLADPKLSHMARYALENIPGLAAAGALRQALRETHGESLIGIINTLGERRERGSAPALVSLLASREPAVVNATITALGKVGGDQASDALRALVGSLEPSLAEGVKVPFEVAEPVRFRLDFAAIVDALLQCADSQAREGRTGHTADLCARLCEAPALPRPCRVAALQTLLRWDARRATPMVVDLMRSDEAPMQALAAGFVPQLPADALAQVLLLLDALPVAPQVMVMSSLADRREPLVLPALLRATRHPDDTVKTVAARSLTQFEANAEIVQRLAQMAATTPAVPAAAARDALLRLRCADTETALAVLGCLGELGGTAALREVSRVAREGGPVLKDRAIAVLAGWPDSTAMDELMTIAKGADNLKHHALALRGFIELIAHPSARAPDQTVALYQQALEVALAPEEKKQVFVGLARLGHPAALRLLEPFLEDPRLRDEAGVAMLQIARARGGVSPQDARAIIRRVQNAVRNEAVLAQAREAIQQLERSEK